MKIKTVQARKQRKALATLTLHEKHKLLSATFSKELRAKFDRRNLPLRKGDHVKVLVGSFKGAEGEVMKIDLNALKVYVDKVVSKKRDGSEVPRPIKASNLMITELDIRDRKRQAVLERKVSKTVVEAEVKKEEAKLKAEEEARIAKEAELKAKEDAEKAKKVEKAKASKTKAGAKEQKDKVSEKSIDRKTKKDWIAEK